ncbi:MAG: hypothetical protein NC548_22800 [Lachnospiraceae bacterium]|nr:hypothetical protein [Lachnospiraceae bacterium]
MFEELKSAFLEMAKLYSPIVREDIIGTVSYLLDEAINDELDTTNLSFLDSGAYKMAFNDVPGLVFKLVEDDTEILNKEETIYNLANEQELSNFFLPTTFIRLPRCIKAYKESEGCDIYFSAIMIQPEVVVSKAEEDNIKTLEKMLPYEFFHILKNTGLRDSKWIKRLIEVNGQDTFLTFLDFCERYHIYDLHNSNIGYLQDRPVIFDWLSDEGDYYDESNDYSI